MLIPKALMVAQSKFSCLALQRGKMDCFVVASSPLLYADLLHPEPCSMLYRLYSRLGLIIYRIIPCLDGLFVRDRGHGSTLYQPSPRSWGTSMIVFWTIRSLPPCSPRLGSPLNSSVYTTRSPTAVHSSSALFL